MKNIYLSGMTWVTCWQIYWKYFIYQYVAIKSLDKKIIWIFGIDKEL